MFTFIKDMFRHPTADEIRARQRQEAERTLPEVEANLEYTAAMRDMYLARLARLANN